MSETLAGRLAAHADDLTYGDLPGEAVEAAKRRVIDSLATAAASWGEPPVENLFEYASGTSGEASVLGADGSASLPAATLANGGQIRYLDWNDTYLALEPGHPSDNLGAVLTVADAEGCSGRDAVLATALAYEVQCRLCDAASLRANGFDHVNYGLVSSALAAGKLMGLGRDELEQAVNLAVNGHVALRQARAGELTEWKGFAFGNAARNAVVAARLADAGVRGPAPIFEGTFGVFEQLTGEFDLDVGGFTDAMIADTHVKFHPVEYHAQAAVNVALDLREEGGIDPSEIERVHNRTYEAAMSIIVEEDEKWDPETRETADHSMPYCVARALVDGEMGLAQFVPEKVRGDDVRDLMDVMTFEEDPAYTGAYPDRLPHAMRIETADGVHEREVDYPKGHAERPLSDDELTEKFLVAADDLSEERVREVVSWATDLDRKGSISELFELMERPSSG